MCNEHSHYMFLPRLPIFPHFPNFSMQIFSVPHTFCSKGQCYLLLWRNNEKQISLKAQEKSLKKKTHFWKVVNSYFLKIKQNQRQVPCKTMLDVGLKCSGHQLLLLYLRGRLLIEIPAASATLRKVKPLYPSSIKIRLAASTMDFCVKELFEWLFDTLFCCKFTTGFPL